MKLVERKTQVVNINDLEIKSLNSIDIAWLSRLKVLIGDVVVDIGSWMYSISKINKSNLSSTSLVYIPSFEIRRHYFVSQSLNFLIKMCKKNKRDDTLMSNYYLMRAFVMWCNENNIEEICELKEINNVYTLVNQYREYLVNRSQAKEIALKTAKVNFNAIINLFDHITGKSLRFSEEIDLITYKTITKNAEPPGNFGLLYKTYKDLFWQLSEFVIKNHEYPICIELNNKEYWGLPDNHNPFNSRRWQKNPKYNPCFNFSTGEFFSIEYVVAKMKGLKLSGSDTNLKHRVRNRMDKHREKINEANTQIHHKERVRLAVMAVHNFTMAFIANTGMNFSTLSEIEWSQDKYESEKIDTKFISIKYRANNRVVSFEIGLTFLKHFKQYLKLRRYLLSATNNESYPYLFFDIKKHGHPTLSKASSKAAITKNNIRLREWFDINEHTASRALRKFKSNYVLEETKDVAISSELMQHDISVAKQNYATSTLAEQSSDMKSFFDHLSNSASNDYTKLSKVNVGNCSNLQQPEKINGSSYEPKCESIYGCLNCKNFSVVANIENYNQMLELVYVIKKSTFLTNSRNHYKSFSSQMLNIIDAYLNHIKTTGGLSDNETSDSYQKIVNEGRVRKFWQDIIELIKEMRTL